MNLVIDTCDTIINLSDYIINNGSIYESKEKLDEGKPVYTFTGWAGRWLQPVVVEAIKDGTDKTAIMKNVYRNGDTVIINAVNYALDVKEYLKHCAWLIEQTCAVDKNTNSLEVELTEDYFEEFSGEYFNRLKTYTANEIYNLLQTEVK